VGGGGRGDWWKAYAGDTDLMALNGVLTREGHTGSHWVSYRGLCT